MLLARAPGIACIRSRTRVQNCARSLAAVAPDIIGSSDCVSTRSAVKPGSTLRRFLIVVASSSVATRSVRQSTTWPAMSRRAAARARGAPPRRGSPLRMACCGSTRMACSAGQIPVNSAATSEIPAANAATRQSICASSSMALRPTAKKPTRASTVTRATTKPAAAPSTNNSSVSVSIWLSSRAALAPVAWRIAISRARAAPRTRRSVPRFQQPIRSTAIPSAIRAWSEVE